MNKQKFICTLCGLLWLTGVAAQNVYKQDTILDLNAALAKLDSAISYAGNSIEELDSTFMHADSVLLTKADSVIYKAKQFLGTKYKYGSTGPQTFDCSGFTQYVFSRFGVPLDHSSQAQSTQGQKVDSAKLQQADLVFFAGRKKNSIGHVGIVVDVDTATHTFSFIHASTHSGVVVSKSTEPYYATRFKEGRRVLPADSTNIAY